MAKRKNLPTVEGSEKVRAAMKTLIEGGEDARDDLVENLRTALDPPEQAELKNLVIKSLGGEFLKQDYRLRDPKTAQTIRGWFVGALGSLEPFDTRSEEVLTRLAREDESEWVRYWSLAHLYWRNAPRMQPTVESILSAPVHASSLVPTLALAVAAKRFNPQSMTAFDLKFNTRSERDLWAALRALQIVGIPELAPKVASLLPEIPSDAITYDVLLALTGPEMGDSGFIALRDLGPERVVENLLRASRDATDHKLRRFAAILRWFRRDQLATLSKAAESSGPDADAARRLMMASDITPSPSLVLQPGNWRAEFAYRVVLEQPARYELLDTLDPAGLREAVRAVAGDNVSSPDDILAVLRSKNPSPPNHLWTSWLETVHASKLQQH
jgi:hypothetical protein